jgi:hypothetical protein
MSSTNNESVNNAELTTENTQLITPTKPSTPIEQTAPVHNDQINDKVNEVVKQQTIDEKITFPTIQRIPFNVDKNEDNDSKDKGYEYIHYCGNKDCEWDCGVLDCGCIDTCRNRCGTRQMFDFD